MKFERYIVVRVVRKSKFDITPDYEYMYTKENIHNIEEYNRMSKYRKHKSMREFGFCEGAESTMIIDTKHENLTTLYKDLLENIKSIAREQRLGQLLDRL